MARYVSLGCRHPDFNLIPEVMHDGKPWRFMGIQSKNQKGWFLTHMANLFNSVTTVSFYDTLGPEATRFCVQ